MPEKDHTAKLEELENKIRLQNKEINEYLDKIEYLEDMIMELEESFLNQSDKADASFLKVQMKDLEVENRDLKNKLSIVKLENVKLKQQLENVKKDKLINASLIQIVENEPISELESSSPKDIKEKKAGISQKEAYKYLKIKCPECETEKNLKIPVEIINQGHKITTLSVPKGMVCEHKFQVLFDKSFNVKRYQLLDYDVPHLEYSKSQIVEDSENITQFATLPFFQEIVTLLRRSTDNREILGAAIFNNKGKVIYASVPSDMLFNIIKEFEARKEKQLQDISKMSLELKNRQKIYSENIEVQNIEFILVLILSKKVNFGMANMIFRNFKKKITSITSNL
ncbi:MAG: hypothetical protein ACFFEY_15680 [Candidatus Thorarchaeota archaeon]